MNRRAKELLGSAYSWLDELYYIGNPCAFQTPHEEKTVARMEREWHEATTA